MDTHSVSILLVDDNEDDYLLTRRLLSRVQSTNFRLEWAATYEAALEAMSRNQYAVYLVDYRLGRHMGLDLLREALARGCHAPISRSSWTRPTSRWASHLRSAVNRSTWWRYRSASRPSVSR
jgi:CheY-like chemotaxis protein